MLNIMFYVFVILFLSGNEQECLEVRETEAQRHQETTDPKRCRPARFRVTARPGSCTLIHKRPLHALNGCRP